MVFVEHNSPKSDIFLIPYLFHVFQDSCFSGSRFFRVQIFQSPGFSGSRFFWVHDFQGLGFSGSQFFRVRVQGPGPGFRKPFLTTTFLKSEKKHCYEKRSIVIRNVDQISIANLITQLFFVTSPRFLYFSKELL